MSSFYFRHSLPSQMRSKGMLEPTNCPTLASLKNQGVQEIVRDYVDPGNVRKAHIIDVSHGKDPHVLDCTRRRYSYEPEVEVGGPGWLVIDVDKDAIIKIGK